MTQTQYASPMEQSRKVGFAVTALAVGIAAFLLGWAPYLGIVVGVVAVVFAILALVRKQPGGMAYTGLALGAVATIFSLIVTIVVSMSPISSSSIEQFAQQPPSAESVPQDSGSESDAEESENTEPSSPTLATTFSDGTHSVGTDISAGTYRNDEAGYLCYYFWKDGTGANAETIDSGHVEEGGAATITVEEGQAFKSNQCGTWVKQ